MVLNLMKSLISKETLMFGVSTFASDYRFLNPKCSFLVIFPFLFLLFGSCSYRFPWYATSLLGFVQLACMMAESSCYCQSLDTNSLHWVIIE
jgi:hypothetical protein